MRLRLLAAIVALAACEDQSVVVARVPVTSADATVERDAPRPRTCGTRLNPVGCACSPGVDTDRECVTFEGPLCATGVTRCIGLGDVGVWGHCEGQRPGVCACAVEGQLRECAEGPCGVSASRCTGGRWAACAAPVCPLDGQVDAPDDPSDELPDDAPDDPPGDTSGDAPWEVEDTPPPVDVTAGADRADAEDEGLTLDLPDASDGALDAGLADVRPDLADTPDALDVPVDRLDVVDVPVDRPDVVDVPLDRPEVPGDIPPDVPVCTPTIADLRACVDTVAAPRPLAPLAFARVTSRRPTLEWSLPTGVDGAVLELCRDRACATVIERLVVMGSSARPTCPLPLGVVFWRLAGVRAGTLGCPRAGASPVWQLDVGAANGGDTSWGVRFDVNGDGYRDVVLRSAAAGSEAGAVMVALGAASGFGAMGSFRTLAPPTGVVTFGAEALPIGDVNGDGFGDLLVRGTAVGTDDDVDCVYLGGTDGIFATSGRIVERRYTLAGLENTQFATGDFDRDGYGDLVIVRTHVPREVTTMVPRLMQPRVDIYRGGPAGPAEGGPTTFVDAPDAAVYFGALTVADFDGDRRPEVALGARGEVVVIYDPLRARRIVRTIRRPDVSDSQRFGEDFLWAADVNGDGFGDLSVLGTGALGTPGTWTWQGSATGLSAGFTDRLTGALFWTVADVNNDGFDDLGARADSTGFAFYTSTGRVFTPTFRSRVTVPSTASAALAGDADGDGDVDVVLRDRATNALLLYRGGPAGTFTGPVRGPLPADAPTGPAGNGAMAW